MNRQEGAAIARAAKAARLPSFEERFWSRVERGDPAQCWPWIGYRYPPGYGCVPFKASDIRCRNSQMTPFSKFAALSHMAQRKEQSPLNSA
jgi:hypothetical protein